MKLNDRKFGFSVKEIHALSGLGAQMYVMEHEKSGARLVYLDRDDENKTFSIAFKTLPTDSTGVFHILEHSVLCGSEKYRLKDPFVELLSGSLNTFLNAMTFKDKTMYPVASTNEKEFLSLAGVYLDAVFSPLAVKDKSAFMQEGWHYEPDEDGNLSYKGVVFNEMKGDYSSPESVADRHIHSMLFEGTCYEHDSGGDPSEITNLTYGEFCQAHSTYYHPSNATVFLDGSMDIDGALALVASYLDRYERIDTDREPFLFKKATPKKESRVVEYEISENEQITDKSRLALAHLTFRFDERERIFGAAVLSSALLSSNESEIKKAMLASGLCEDLQVNIGEGIYENYFEVDFINVKDGRDRELEELFYATVSSVAERSIDREELLAAINSLEFSLRERDYGTIPLGVVYAMNLMESYLYSDDAVSGLTFDREIAFLRENLDGGFFENLLLDIFIKNESKVRLLLVPSRELGEKMRLEEAKKLSEIKASLTEEQLDGIINDNEKLLAWQNCEDSESAKMSIPRLRVSDIPSEIKSIPTEVTTVHGATLVTHPLATNGISYTELYFDVSDLSRDEIFTSALVGLFLGNLATENYTAKELVKTLKSEIGTFSAALKPTTHTDGSTKIYFKVFISSLCSKQKKAAELLREVLTKTLFDDKEAMKNIVKQAYIASEESFATAGHRAAKGRVSAMLSSEGAALEYYSGYEAHLRYKALARSFDELFSETVDKISAFLKKYLVRERLTVSLSEDSPENGKDFVSSVVSIFESSGKELSLKCNIAPLDARREGIRIPARVAFSSLCAVSTPESPSELGLALVAANLVSYEYLWGEIRVKGGAYGAGMSAVRTGQASFYSYRDPTPVRSIERIKAAPEFLLSVVEGAAINIEKYIIGAIGETSPYLTPRAKAGIGTQRYLGGITDSLRKETRNAILFATEKKIESYAKRLKTAVSDAPYCIVASTDKLADAELDAILEI